MKLIHFDKKEAKLQVEDADDLFSLSQIIEPGDTLRGRTLRKIKVGKETDRKQESDRKPVFLGIQVEKTEFSSRAGVLRATGIITEGPEDVQKGEHHTFAIEPGSSFTLIKNVWLNFQTKRVQESSKEKSSRVLLCVMDREEATFALLKRYGYEILSTIKGKVSKKGMQDEKAGNFYGEIIGILQEYTTRYHLASIVLASPAFWKDEVMKQADDKELKKKIILATCNDTGRTGINEVLKRPEVKEALKEDRIAREVQAVDELLQEISKQGAAAYGMEETGKAVDAGAVASLLITDSCIGACREKGAYPMLETYFKKAEQAKGNIIIISSDHEGGKQLDGLGGIGALLRYKLHY